MNRTFFLYKHINCTNNISINPEYKTEFFKPSIYKLNKHGNKHLIYWLWFLFTMGRYRIFYITHKNKVIHYSHCLPKFFKFPFMRTGDIMIGPCWTDSQYRGQSLYPYALCEITQRLKKTGREFYIFTEDNNIPSQKGILKAGFRQVGLLKTTKTGVYKFYQSKPEP